MPTPMFINLPAATWSCGHEHPTYLLDMPLSVIGEGCKDIAIVGVCPATGRTIAGNSGSIYTPYYDELPPDSHVRSFRMTKSEIAQLN